MDTQIALKNYNDQFTPLHYNLMSHFIAEALGCTRTYTMITNAAEREHNRIMNIMIDAALAVCEHPFYAPWKIIQAALEVSDLGDAAISSTDVWLRGFAPALKGGEKNV